MAASDISEISLFIRIACFLIALKAAISVVEFSALMMALSEFAMIDAIETADFVLTVFEFINTKRA
jgi:hypothetical protein